MSQRSQLATIEFLPNEILEHILLFLDWEDRQAAMLVSRRWAAVAFGRGSKVVLNIYHDHGTNLESLGYRSYFRGLSNALNHHNLEKVHNVLLRSERPYQNVKLQCNTEPNKQSLMLDILSHLQPNVESLILDFRKCDPIRLEWLAKVLQICSNLKLLRIKASEVVNADKLDFQPMKNLRTLHINNDLINLIPNALDVFANVTSLHMDQVSERSPTDLLRKLGHQLSELSVSLISPFSSFGEQDFPMLETLKLNHWEKLVSEESVEQFHRFLKRTPKLKALTLRSLIGKSVLQLLEQFQENLEYLCVHCEHLGRAKFTLIAKLKNLKWLRLEHAFIRSPLKNGPVLKSVRQVTLSRVNGIEDSINQILRNTTPNLTVLELLYLRLFDADIDFDLYSSIAFNLPCLKRLVICEPWLDAELIHFMRFCGKVVVPELSMQCSNLQNRDGHSSKMWDPAPHIRKLIIDGKTIESNVYVPMMESMPELRRLELALDHGYDALKTVRIQFPRCEIVRKPQIDDDDDYENDVIIGLFECM